jgi:hypothetical protein
MLAVRDPTGSDKTAESADREGAAERCQWLEVAGSDSIIMEADPSNPGWVSAMSFEVDSLVELEGARSSSPGCGIPGTASRSRDSLRAAV